MPGYPAAAPPKKTRWGLIIGIIALVLVLICGGGAAAIYFVVKAGNEAVDGLAEITDITVLACTALQGKPEPTVTVTWEVENTSTSARDYSPTFVVRDATGARVGDGGDVKTGIPPGKRNVYLTSVTLDAPSAGPFTCELDS
jgi:hypothetical protein